mgnify:CR=1 FL=1
MKKQIIIFIIFFIVGFLAFKLVADYFKKNNSTSIKENLIFKSDLSAVKTGTFSYVGIASNTHKILS